MCRMTATGFRWQEAIDGCGVWYAYASPLMGFCRYSRLYEQTFKPLYRIIVRPRGSWNGRSF